MAEKVKKASSSKTPRKTATVKATTTDVAPKKTAPKKKAAKVTQMAVSHEEIAQLAHRFWAERGHPHGSHEDDWLRAESELLGKAS
jgi:hypothetical protein